MNSTPISDAAASNSEPHGYQVVPYFVAQTLEHDNNALRAEIARLNHQHANDEAANQMLSDACANMNKTEQEPRSGLSALADVLAAELTLEKVGKQMADDFQSNGKYWPRPWMLKHTEDRKTLIEARRVLIERAEAANV